MHRERKALRACSFLSELKFRPPKRRCLAAEIAGNGRGERAFVTALLRMTAKRRTKEEADPSPIHAGRVWAQDDNEKKGSGNKRQRTDP